MIVANPSDSEEKTMPVKAYLPKGTKPEDITEKGNFIVEYDFEKSLYYAYQEVKLGPKETVVLELALRDVWSIPEEEIKAFTEHTQKILKALDTSEYYEQAKILAASITSRLDKITALENQPGATPEQKISNHELNLNTLKEIKKDIGILEDLALEAGSLSSAQVSELKGEGPVVSEVIRAETPAQEVQNLKTIKLKIEISNPAREIKDIPLKYYLPSEIKPEYVESLEGLELVHDYHRGIYYVYKEAVKLAPEEKKEFIIEVKDVWNIPPSQIEILKQHTEELAKSLSLSAYKELAKPLVDKITATLNSIIETQNNPNISVEGHIGDYRANLIRLEETKKDVAKLEKLVNQEGGSVKVTLAERESQAPKSEAIKHRVVGGLLRGAQGVELVGKSIFRGKAPDASTTWKIIWIIMGFLAVVSFLFFILWWMQIKFSKSKKKGQINQESDDR